MILSKHYYFLTVFLPIVLGGCASVSVSTIEKQGIPANTLPKKIYVREFSFPSDSFNLGREAEALDDLIKSEKHALAIDLSKQIIMHVAPCEILPKSKPLPKGNYWLLQGSYVQVYQGSRALRILIGFGAGKTTMETHAVFSSLRTGKPQPFLSLETTGGSGLSPGIVGAINPSGALSLPGALANAFGASFGGLSADRNRTAREIAATLSEYCYQRNLMPKNRVRRPKRLRNLPPLQWPEISLPFINS